MVSALDFPSEGHWFQAMLVSSLLCCFLSLDKKLCSALSLFTQAPVVQTADNFIHRISHYPTVSISAKISLFRLVQANMHTSTTVTFGSVQKPWTTFNVKYNYFRP